MFDNLDTDTTIQEETDRLGGSSALDSDLYDLNIKAAFLTFSTGEAMCLNVHFETATKQELRQKFWMTSAKSKGCKNYYTDAKGTKQYLPGFNQANALCLLTVGKEVGPLVKTGLEDQVIPLYNFAIKKEEPTKVQMLTALLGKSITAGVVNQIVDKTAKDPDTGEYLPTGETRHENEVDKFFRQRDGLTVPEIKARLKEPAFRDKWVAKWKGEVKDKTSDTSGATAGAPKPKPKREIGKQAPQEKLFA